MFGRLVNGLFFCFVLLFGLCVWLSFATIARAEGAVCGSDVDCARYTIEQCEQTQEPWDCYFGHYVSEDAIEHACLIYLRRHGEAALACEMHADRATLVVERE